MKIRYDKEADAIYLRFREGKIEESDEIKNGIIVDYDSKGKPIAIEILNAKELLEKRPELIVDFPPSVKVVSWFGFGECGDFVKY